MNSESQNFLAHFEMTESDFSDCTGKQKLHLLTTYAEEMTVEEETSAVAWAEKGIETLNAIRAKKKSVASVAAETEAETVQETETLPPPPAEIEIYAEPVPVEVVEERETSAQRAATEERETAIRGVVGQEKAVAYLERELRNIERGQPLPFLALYDDTGLGKTHLTTRFLKALPRNVASFSLNCKDKLNITDKQGKDYFAAISEALAEGIPTIVHLDEFGNKNGNGSLQKFIMAHISKAADGKCLAIHGGDPLPFNPHLLGFIVTSFDPSKAAVDIVDRIKQPAELVLTNYSAEELTDILRNAINRACISAGVQVPRMTDASLVYIARSMRGNARQANDVADEIRKEKGDDESFTLTLESAGKVMKTVGVFPHGLNQAEIKILSALTNGAKNRDTLTQKTGVEKAHWVRAINFLAEGTGRGNPFQLCKADGSPVADGCGALVDYERGKYFLTLHGCKVVSVLKKNGWID